MLALSTRSLKDLQLHQTPQELRSLTPSILVLLWRQTDRQTDRIADVAKRLTPSSVVGVSNYTTQICETLT